MIQNIAFKSYLNWRTYTCFSSVCYLHDFLWEVSRVISCWDCYRTLIRTVWRLARKIIQWCRQVEVNNHYWTSEPKKFATTNITKFHIWGLPTFVTIWATFQKVPAANILFSEQTALILIMQRFITSGLIMRCKVITYKWNYYARISYTRISCACISLYAALLPGLA